MRNQSGFTFLEMMITIAIIAIVTAGVVPNMISWRNNAQLSAGARQIYSDLQDARKMAIKTNRVVNVDFNVGSGSYAAAGVARNLPPGIQIDSAVFTTSGNIASFNSLGFGRTFLSEDNSGTVTISRSAGSRASTIAVTSGGSIRIQ